DGEATGRLQPVAAAGAQEVMRAQLGQRPDPRRDQVMLAGQRLGPGKRLLRGGPVAAAKAAPDYLERLADPGRLILTLTLLEGPSRDAERSRQAAATQRDVRPQRAPPGVASRRDRFQVAGSIGEPFGCDRGPCQVQAQGHLALSADRVREAFSEGGGLVGPAG